MCDAIAREGLILLPAQAPDRSPVVGLCPKPRRTTMIDLLVSVLIFAIVFGALWYIIQLLPIPEPFGQIVRIVLIVIAVVWLIYLLLGLLGHAPRFGRL